MEKKDLEQLFRDKFKDFQETPDPRVWKSIETSLEKKKKKRVVPIWWKVGGVAALLAVLFYVVNPFAGDTELDGIKITETELQKGIKEKGVRKDVQNPIEASGSQADTNELTDSNSIEQGAEEKATVPQKQDASTTRNADYQFTQQQDGQLTSNDEVRQPASTQEEEDVLGVNTLQDSEKVVAAAVEEPKEAIAEKKGFEALNQGDFESKEEENTVAGTDNISDKKSILEAIKEQEEEEETAVAKNSGNKWSVAPAVAPIYFNGVGEGSPVHSNFSANSKSGNVNLSYGVNVAYELNNKLSIRTGLHRVNFGYDTNEIVFSSSLNASTNEDIDNINYNDTSRGLVIQSKASPSPADANSTADFVARSPQFEGRMVQQIGYMEVPLELNYALIDKKFGVTLIGGMSSLFLVDNAVSLESDGLVTEMGEANNVNDINFSTNVGVGLNYKFSDKMQANIEPVFKYQLNTFSNTAGNFRPFSVGVYSGLSFKF
ncbi:MAG: hypothetical protein ED555_03760 [Allomuricauda sp.]|nr:MAG: hypothetical protein ED555_03760 [Allomuricauda sp.]